MSQHHQRHRVGFSAEQMFDLVADVESYPSFLPWCHAAKIRQRDGTVMLADLTVGTRLFRETFSSRVVLDRPSSVLVSYAGGPLKHLENRWIFTPTEQGCEIEFYLDFEIRSRLMAAVMDAFFDKAYRSMLQAFEKRAEDLYRRS